MRDGGSQVDGKERHPSGVTQPRPKSNAASISASAAANGDRSSWLKTLELRCACHISRNHSLDKRAVDLEPIRIPEMAYESVLKLLAFFKGRLVFLGSFLVNPTSPTDALENFFGRFFGVRVA
jgi:hypothetical protein